MRTALAPLALVALLGLAGCPNLDEPLPCGFPVGPAPADQNPGIALTGRPVRLTVFPTAPGCGPETPAQPTSATAEVSRADGTPVPSQVAFTPGSSQATVDFTPEQPGPYHALVAFSPVGGLHQFDLLAALDLSAGLPRHTLPSRCVDLQRTTSGAWVCDETVLRDGLEEARFYGARLAVAGEVLWVADYSRIRRFVDTGTELTLTATLDVSRDDPIFLHASAEELLVVSPGLIDHYTFGGEQLSATPPVSWELDPDVIDALGLFGVLLRDGEWVGFVHEFEGADQICPYRLTASGLTRTAAACTSVPAPVVGFEPSVLWTANVDAASSGTTLRRWVWAEGQLQEQALLALKPPAQLSFSLFQRSSAVPVVLSSSFHSQPLTAVVSSAPGPQGLHLEHLDADIQEPLASPSFFWGRSPRVPGPTGSIQVRARPSAP